jgi:imidazolonepropionase-like amidohydrolase
VKKFVISVILVLIILFFIIYCNCKHSIPNNDTVGRTIAMTNVFLIDGNGSEPIPDAIIVIEGEYIGSIGRSSSTDIPGDSEVIDLQGSYVVPGFINAHVHGGYNEKNLKEWAKTGVTTVRDLGNLIHSPVEAFSIRNKLLNDNMNSRLVAAGPLVTTVGGYGNYPIVSVADAEQKIDGLLDVGADLIKVAIEDDLQGRTWPILSLDEIKMIAETSHKRDKRVCAHISRSRHLEMAIKGGVDDVCHMVIDNLPDSLITSMIEEDIYWVPTLELWRGVSELHNIDWDVTATNNLRSFVQAGGKVALGTDYDGYITPFELGLPMAEIQLMQEAGMTPMQIIVAGTKYAAHVCDRANTLGTLEPGKIADMIVVSNNPLDDLESLLKLELVIHNGEIIEDWRK